MMTYQIDTNALLRFLTKDIPRQAKATENLLNQAQQRMVNLEICEPVFIETAVALRNYFKFPKIKVVEMLESLMSFPNIDIENRQQIAQALAIFAQMDLDLTDCLIYLRAKAKRQQIFTFDSRLSLLASSQEKAN